MNVGVWVSLCVFTFLNLIRINVYIHACPSESYRLDSFSTSGGIAQVLEFFMLVWLASV